MVAALAVPAMVSAGTHNHSAGHGDDEHAHDAGGSDTAPDAEVAAVVPPKPYDPALPIDLGGVEGVTPEQQAAAENLLSATILALPQFADPAEAVVGQPVAAWTATCRSMLDLLTTTDPNSLVASHHGEVTAEWVLATAVIEPLVHAWDLAQAAGLEAVLDDEAVEACLMAIAPMAEQFAATGMYAPALTASAQATPQQQLLALLGRKAA